MRINTNTVPYPAGGRENDIPVQAEGAKYMKRVEKGEKVNLFKELGSGVSVELSQEGMEELNKRLSEMKNENPDLRILTREEKERLLKESLKPVKNLLPHNVGNRTEKERQELIAQGLREARELSQSLDAEKAGLFMKAMKFMLDWEPRAYRENPKAFDEVRQEQVNWKKSVEDTRLPDY